jgi:hypothetical protein
MKLKMLLASCVIAVSACANVATNGPNATDANLLDGAQSAYVLGKSLYDAGTITDEDIAKMLALLGMELDAWQAQIDAHQAGA